MRPRNWPQIHSIERRLADSLRSKRRSWSHLSHRRGSGSPDVASGFRLTRDAEPALEPPSGAARLTLTKKSIKSSPSGGEAPTDLEYRQLAARFHVEHRPLVEAKVLGNGDGPEENIGSGGGIGHFRFLLS